MNQGCIEQKRYQGQNDTSRTRRTRTRTGGTGDFLKKVFCSFSGSNHSGKGSIKYGGVNERIRQKNLSIESNTAYAMATDCSVMNSLQRRILFIGLQRCHKESSNVYWSPDHTTRRTFVVPMPLFIFWKSPCSRVSTMGSKTISHEIHH